MTTDTWSRALRFSKIARFAPAAAILALTLLFFYRLAFTDLILARGDTFAYFYPYWHARNAALMAGQLPLWTPDLFMGVPLLANSQLGTFYPPNWLVAPLSPPDGIRVSILIHVAWTMVGVYLLARRTLGVDSVAGLLAAFLFGLGGYVGAHVEQINQLQGLAWLPWLFLALDVTTRSPQRGIPLLAAGLALQFFTGHTQTVFITGLGLGLYALCQRQLRALIGLAIGGLLALPLALPQLLPTMEMTSVSNRSGGLNPNQATAFSFSPFVLGRGLLPSFDTLIFGEYVAYGGVIGFGLALLGALRGWPQTAAGTPLTARLRILRRLGWGNPLSPRVTWIVIGIVGLALAFGLYNPLYWWLATLPGFNLFRVPARWLALFALAAAMLAALGLHGLRALPRPRPRLLAGIVVVFVVLAASSALTLRQPDLTTVSLPTMTTLIGWLVALVALLALLWRRSVALLAFFAAVELFFASQALPYNDLTSPEVYDNRRLTTNQLLAYQQNADSPVTGRVLSISELLYDPGDRYALEARFAAQGMSALATQTAFTAIKMQDTLSPNLPLLYGLPSADGFDGGLLPTRYYTAFSSLLLPPSELRTVDGRLREVLSRDPACAGACIPEQRWLDLMNVQYLITDKIHDLWYEDVAYDTSFARVLAAGETLDYAAVPPFESTRVHVLATCPAETCPPVTVTLTAEDGQPITGSSAATPVSINDMWLIDILLDAPFTPTSLRLQADADMTIHAVTLVDGRTGDFQQLQPQPWQRVLSSDIELYENSGVFPRAFVVYDVHATPDTEQGTEDALDAMRDPAFDPLVTAYVAVADSAGGDSAGGDSVTSTGDNAAPSSGANGQVVITGYTATQVALVVTTDAPGLLVLADAYYPGWTATLNGSPTEVLRADAMFRAVAVPEGESTVVFTYAPHWLVPSLVAGGTVWLLVIVVFAWFRWSSGLSKNV